jgi:16S rRNA C967 or C1407 C5-methylase (RsmB/RsmF family)
VQLELVREAWGKVKPGGFLAYSVCSVLHEEGPDLVKRAELTGAREVRSWSLTPQQSPHGDGFWAVLLKKA